MTGSVGCGRQSHGKQKSINEQLGCYSTRRKEEGWYDRGLFTDKISAGPFAAKARSDWAKLLKSLADPTVNVLWLWESSRGDRKLSSWSRMLEICEEHDVKLFVETHERIYDMSISRDWKTLAEDGTDSEYESRKGSDRQKRNVNAQLENGRPPGRIPYGYRRIYGLDEEGKRILIRQEADPAEAPAVREIFARLRAGDAANAIAADLNKHGPALRTGKPWTLNRVVTIAKSACYAGIRVHTSERGMASRRSLAPSVQVHDGAWEPLVTRECFYAVQAFLADPARKTTRPGGARHLLSYVAKCGVCGGPLTVHGGSRRKETYYCPARGHVTVPKDVLDVTVTVEAVSYLIETELGRQQESGETPAELQAIRDELAELRHRKENIAGGLASGKLSVDTASSAEKEIDAKIAGLEKRDRQLSVPAGLHDLLDDPDWPVAEKWVKMSLAARKEAMRLLLSEEHLGVLYVMPAPPEGRGRGAQSYPLWRRLEWRKHDVTAPETLLGRRRVSKTEWTPWYVVSGDTARATESGQVHVASGDQASAAESGTVVAGDLFAG